MVVEGDVVGICLFVGESQKKDNSSGMDEVWRAQQFDRWLSDNCNLLYFKEFFVYLKEQLGLTITSECIFVINVVFGQILYLDSDFNKCLGPKSLFLIKLWVCRSCCQLLQNIFAFITLPKFFKI